MSRWIQEGYWGQYFIRLSAEGSLAFQRPMGGGRWRMYVVNLNPGDGGGAKLTNIEIYDNAGLVAPGVVPGGIRLPGSPPPQAYGYLLTEAGSATPATPGQPGYVRPGAPPNARLVDILRSFNDGIPIAAAPPHRTPTTDDDEP